MSVRVVNSGPGEIKITASTTPAISVAQPSVNVVNINPLITGIGTGPAGPTGAQGPAGANGQGVPAGGSTNQVLLKSSGSDYATAWGNVAYANVTGTPTLAAVAQSGNYSDINGTPTLATVAQSGAYADLTGKPTIVNNVPTVLGLNRGSVNVTLTSDGNNITFTPASTSLAGVMTAAEHSKLANLNASADVTNSSSVAAAGAVMDADFAQNGLMRRTGSGQYDTVDATTTNIAEGTNQYHTDAKVNALIQATNVTALTGGSNVILTTTTDVSGANFVLGENNLAANSTTKVPTQASVKAYVDSQLSPALIDNNGSVDVPTGITQAALRTAIGVDAAGADNSTNVTLANVASNYLSISGQVITAGTVPVALGGTGATDAAGARANLDLQDNDIRGKFSAGPGISYNSTTGEISSTVSDTNTQNTTTLSFQDSGDDIVLRNTTGGAGSGNQDININAGSNISLNHTDSNNITIGVTGVLTSGSNVPDGNISASSVTQHLSTTGSGVGGINISESNGVFSLTGSLDITADAAPVLGGNLDASGNNIVEVEEIGLRDKIYHDDDTDTYIQFSGNDSFKVVTGNIEKLSATSNKVEINPAQANVDLQVNGDTANNVLYVDASANKVGILTSTPASALHVVGDISVTGNVSVVGTVDGEDVSTLVSHNDFTGGTGIGFSSGTISVNVDTTIETAAAAPNATITVTGPSGQADSITLAAGSNITLTETGDQITIASTASGGASALNDLSDVTVGSASSGQYLVHNGGAFVNQALDISQDNDPDLGGDLDVGDHSIITSTGNKDITLNPDGTGKVNIGTYPIRANDSDPGNSENGQVLMYVASEDQIKLVLPPQGTVTTTGSPSNNQIATFTSNSNELDGLASFTFDGTNFTTPNVLVNEGTLSAPGRYGSGARVTTTMFTDSNANKTPGDVYVFRGGDSVWDIQADASADGTATGMLAVAGSTSSAAGMVLSGIVRVADNSSLGSATGAILYLDTTAGHVTATKPTGTGKIVRIVGYVVDPGGAGGATNDGVIYFDPSKDWIELS